MTSGNPSSSTREPSADSLLEKLAAVLPKACKFGVYHLSTPPSRTDALYSPPPGQQPDKTYWEHQFLAVSIASEATTEASSSKPSSTSGGELDPLSNHTLVLALEVFIFTTAHSTTIFVSKADSTGYLQLLGLPKGTPSPIREVTNAFVDFLVEHRSRKGIQTVVSLFARAQSQYLFPGSAENSGKHVLDDRGLVKWWCRVLNPLLGARNGNHQGRGRGGQQWADVKGYLIVPGLDHYETRAFLPRSSDNAANWTIGHPLQRISHYTDEYDWVPPRCLIPRYPDDPKCRFRDELDEEAARWKQDTGSWRSVKSLDQFWEMMAYRQECSSGRLTGFIWVVFDAKKAGATSQALSSVPSSANAPYLPTPTTSLDPPVLAHPPSTPPRRRFDIAQSSPQSSPLKNHTTPGFIAGGTPSKHKEHMVKKKKRKLTGRIISRQPHIKTRQRNRLLDRTVSTAYYYWSPEGRGERIVDETDYKRMVELLLHLDFSTLAKACSSTKRWIGEVATGGVWGREIVGTRESPASETGTNGGGGGGAAAATDLAGLVRRKRPADAEMAPRENRDAAEVVPGQPVNVLGAGLMRKKRKGEDQPPATTVAGTKASGIPVDAGNSSTDEPKVNILGVGLVRKKPKPA